MSFKQALVRNICVGFREIVGCVGFDANNTVAICRREIASRDDINVEADDSRFVHKIEDVPDKRCRRDKHRPARCRQTLQIAFGFGEEGGWGFVIPCR